MVKAVRLAAILENDTFHQITLFGLVDCADNASTLHVSIIIVFLIFLYSLFHNPIRHRGQIHHDDRRYFFDVHECERRSHRIDIRVLSSPAYTKYSCAVSAKLL